MFPSSRVTALGRLLLIVHLDRKAVSCGRWIPMQRGFWPPLLSPSGLWFLAKDHPGLARRLLKPRYRWWVRR